MLHGKKLYPLHTLICDPPFLKMYVMFNFSPQLCPHFSILKKKKNSYDGKFKVTFVIILDLNHTTLLIVVQTIHLHRKCTNAY